MVLATSSGALKVHSCLNKPAIYSSRFAYICITFLWTPDINYFQKRRCLIISPLSVIAINFTFFISSQGQASALKVAYIFKIFGAQNYLMVAQQFDQVIPSNSYACEEYSKFQGSKSVFVTRDFKTFLIMLLRRCILVNCRFNSYFTFITN